MCGVYVEQCRQAVIRWLRSLLVSTARRGLTGSTRWVSISRPLDLLLLCSLQLLLLFFTRCTQLWLQRQFTLWPCSCGKAQHFSLQSHEIVFLLLCFRESLQCVLGWKCQTVAVLLLLSPLSIRECLQCFDTVGWAAGRACSLWKTGHNREL